LTPEGISDSAIAKRAGVWVATASLALRGKPVAKATAVRIRQVAEEMGCRPNPLLASLATRKFRSAKGMVGTPLAIFDFPDDVKVAHLRQIHDQSNILAREARNLVCARDQLGFASLHLDVPLEGNICCGLENITEETSRQSVLLLDRFIRCREQGCPRNPTELLITQNWQEGKTLRPRL